MKRLFLFLLAVPSFAAITMSGVSADHISHSTALIHFSVTGTTVPYTGGFNVYWNWLKVCWSPTAGTCQTTGTAGTVMPTSYPNDQSAGLRQSSPYAVILTGLPASTPLEVCPQVSQDNVTWVQSCTTFTTLGAPAGGPVEAEKPRNTVVPTVPTDYTGFHSGASVDNGTGAGRITTCANLQADIDAAQATQTSYGTVISLAAGQANKCADRYMFRNNPPDVHSFATADVNVSNDTIRWDGSGSSLGEGHGVQFGQNYSGLPGEYGTDANDCAGIKPGQVYYLHFTNIGADPNHFQLTCNAPYPKGRVMTLPDSGGGPNMYVAPYPRRKSEGGQLYPIIVRTATPDSQLPPPGTRINPAWEPKLAVIQPDRLCPGLNCFYTPAGGDRKAFALGFGYMFDDGVYNMIANTWGIGLEIQGVDDTGDGSSDPMPTWNLITFKQGSSDNVLDRCYIHGQYPFPNRLAWGILWDGHNNAITNSYFDRIVFPYQPGGNSVYQTEGTQFIQAATGPGPYIFYNNFFQSTGNGMHFNGGGDGGFQNTYAQDILIQRNTFTQNPAGNGQQYCYGNPGADGYQYRNRQFLEFKGGWRAWMDGNIFEYDCHWLASSTVALTSVAGGIFDISFTNNTFRHDSSGYMMGSSTQGGPPLPQTPTSRYTYKNNLFWDIDGFKYLDHNSGAYTSGQGWRGYIVQTAQDGEDMIQDHVTIVDNTGFVPSMYFLASGGAAGFRFTNSIFRADADLNQTGNGARIDGNMNATEARSCLNGGASYIAEALLTCDWRFPGSVVTGNLVTSNSLTQAQVLSAWPSQATMGTPSNLALVNWTQYDKTLPSPNYHLKNSSVYISGGTGKAADGLDRGADIDKLERAQGKVYFTSAIPASTTASINFVAPDGQGCPVDVSSTDSTLVNSFTRFADTGGTAGPRTVGLTGLTARTDYFFRVNCAVEQPTGTFHTN